MQDMHHYCRVNYWKRSTDGVLISCTEKDNWDECEICPVSTYSSYGCQRFTRAQEHQIGGLLHLLEQAYDRGQEQKLREVRKVLGFVS